MGLSKSVGIGLLVFTIACLCLAIAIGLSLHYAIPRTIDYVQRTDTVGNCLPETTTPDETNCTARRYNTQFFKLTKQYKQLITTHVLLTKMGANRNLHKRFISQEKLTDKGKLLYLIAVVQKG